MIPVDKANWQKINNIICCIHTFMHDTYVHKSFALDINFYYLRDYYILHLLKIPQNGINHQSCLSMYISLAYIYFSYHVGFNIYVRFLVG